jgi:hypothetical protein
VTAPALEPARILEPVGAVLRRHLGGDGAPELLETITGNVNTILKLAYQGRRLGVRLATHTYRFRYEKDIIKEIFALFLIYHGRDGGNDATARELVEGILAAPQGSHVGHALVRQVLYYDWSCTALPWPFFIFEWIDGTILWHTPSPDQYFQAGANLAELHGIGFDAYYRDIFRIGREPLPWAECFGAALEREAAAARPRLPPALAAKVGRFDAAGLTPARPCLIHNDYSGGNILVAAEGGQKIVDWDNWLVEAPELDLLKMRYWTAIGQDGRLAPDPARFEAFLAGYRSRPGAVIDPDRLRAYALLWLLRAYNFESAKRHAPDQAPDPAAVDADLSTLYPPPARYEEFLAEL